MTSVEYKNPERSVVLEELVVLLDSCCEDLWKVAAMRPEGLLGRKKRKIIHRLLEDIVEEAPESYRRHLASEEFDPPDLTNTDAAMLLSQCRTAVRIMLKQRDQSHVAV